MWVRYCRPPIGAHFHPTPQPLPVPQQLGEKDGSPLVARRVCAAVGDRRGASVQRSGSPRTGVIAHVHPETSISKQQTHQSGEPIWHAFTQFVKKTSVPDSVIMLLLSPERPRQSLGSAGIHSARA